MIPIGKASDTASGRNCPMSKVNRCLLYWLPRILWIVFTLFVSLFALDVFEPGIPFWRALGGFLIHLVPVYLLVIILIAAWRWEWIGAIASLILALLYIFVMSHGHLHWSEYVAIVLPLIIMGILFLLNWFFRNKRVAE